LTLTSLPPYPPVPLIAITAVVVEDETIDVRLNKPIPNNMRVDLILAVKTQSMAVSISTAVSVPIPNCTCSTIDTSVTPWQCCDDNVVQLHFQCGTCRFSLYLDETTVTYAKNVAAPGCDDEESSSTQVINSSSHNISSWINVRLGECPDIYLDLPKSRCKKWYMDFELRCYDLLNHLINTQYESVETPEPDLEPPGLTGWNYTDTDSESCHWEFRLQATDECLFPFFIIDIYWKNSTVSRYIDWWGECDRRIGDPGHPTAPGDCDEGCKYYNIPACFSCYIDCVEIQAFDKCGNWSTAKFEGSSLPQINSVSFSAESECETDPTGEDKSFIADGSCDSSDSANPGWRQYINLEKTVDEVCSPCTNKTIFPSNHSMWMVMEVQVDPPMQDVPIYWHFMDPWHRPAPDGDHNNWNENPDPLWNYIELNSSLTFDCQDMSQWDSINDNHQILFNTPFRNECGTVVTNISYTDCDGKARIRFNTSTYGGDNHKIVADVCSNWAAGLQCVQPAVSETIEVWRYVEAYLQDMEEGTPPGLIDCGSLPPFHGPFELQGDWVVSAFEDGFIEVEVIIPEVDLTFQFQTFYEACEWDYICGTNPPEPLSDWPTPSTPYYQVNLMGDCYMSTLNNPCLNPPGYFRPSDLDCSGPAYPVLLGLSCDYLSPGNTCDDRRGRVWVGAITDWYTVYPTKDEDSNTWMESPDDYIKLATVHELGHLIGYFSVGTAPNGAFLCLQQRMASGFS
jgi:hypothetical protein